MEEKLEVTVAELAKEHGVTTAQILRGIDALGVRFWAKGSHGDPVLYLKSELEHLGEALKRLPPEPSRMSVQTARYL